VVNALFYTFSTIAQSLAGAIALLGAFVLFRLQSLNTEIDDNASQIASVAEIVQRTEEAKTLYRNAQYRELLNLISNVSIPAGVYQLTRELGRFPVLLDRRDLIILRFKIAFYLTIGLILTSVLLLTVAPKLATIPFLTWLAFALGLIWLAACLTSYLLLMLESLK
jgi:hypothetical protein